MLRKLWCHDLAILFFSVLIAPTFSTNAENWALLVAVDDYKYISPDLRFCKSDAERFKVALTKIQSGGFKEEHIKLLRDSEVTKKKLKQTFKEWLIDNVKPGDKALFYFSGHGVQMKNPRALEEEDGYDELLCLHDSFRHSYTFLRDNELGSWMDQVNTNQKLVILDCCHSGTGTRNLLVGLDDQTNNLPRPKAYYPTDGAALRESTIDEIRAYDPDIEDTDLASALGAEARAASIGDRGGESSIAGCRDDQVSMESPGIGGGVLTHHLIKSMGTTRTDINKDGLVTAQELWNETRKRIKKEGWNQEPQFYGQNEVAVIGTFSSTTEAIEKKKYDGIVNRISESSIELSIGDDNGVTRGSIYTVFNNEHERKSEIRISKVEPTVAYAQVVGDGESVFAGDFVVEERHFVESEDLLLLVETLTGEDYSSDAIATQLTQKLRDKIQQMPNIRLVDENQAPDRILTGLVKPLDNRFRVLLRVVNVNVGNSSPNYSIEMRADQIDNVVSTCFADHDARDEDGKLKNIEGLTSLLRASYVLKTVANLENPNSSFAINLTLDKGDLATYQIGEVVRISMRPERDCYVYILDIGSSGKINVLFPNEFEPNNFLNRGQEYTIPSTDEYSIELGGPPGDERIKAIATTQMIPLNRIRPDNPASPIPSFAENAPELLETSMSDLRLKPRPSWTTETVMFTVGKPEIYGTREPLELYILE